MGLNQQEWIKITCSFLGYGLQTIIYRKVCHTGSGTWSSCHPEYDCPPIQCALKDGVPQLGHYHRVAGRSRRILESVFCEGWAHTLRTIGPSTRMIASIVLKMEVLILSAYLRKSFLGCWLMKRIKEIHRPY